MYQFAQVKRSGFIILDGATPETPSVGTIYGWYITPQAYDAFLVSEYSKTKEGKEYQNLENIGTISITFHAAWEGNKPPADEPPAKGEVRTVQGPRGDAAFTPVRRNIGVQRAIVSIRYDK